MVSYSAYFQRGGNIMKKDKMEILLFLEKMAKLNPDIPFIYNVRKRVIVADNSDEEVAKKYKNVKELVFPDEEYSAVESYNGSVRIIMDDPKYVVADVYMDKCMQKNYSEYKLFVPSENKESLSSILIGKANDAGTKMANSFKYAFTKRAKVDVDKSEDKVKPANVKTGGSVRPSNIKLTDEEINSLINRAINDRYSKETIEDIKKSLPEAVLTYRVGCIAAYEDNNGNCIKIDTKTNRISSYNTETSYSVEDIERNRNKNKNSAFGEPVEEPKKNENAVPVVKSNEKEADPYLYAEKNITESKTEDKSKEKKNLFGNIFTGGVKKIEKNPKSLFQKIKEKAEYTFTKRAKVDEALTKEETPVKKEEKKAAKEATKTKTKKHVPGFISTIGFYAKNFFPTIGNIIKYKFTKRSGMDEDLKAIEEAVKGNKRVKKAKPAIETPIKAETPTPVVNPTVNPTAKPVEPTVKPVIPVVNKKHELIEKVFIQKNNEAYCDYLAKNKEAYDKYLLKNRELFNSLGDFEKMFIEDAIAECLVPGDNEFRQMLNERCVNQEQVLTYFETVKKNNASYEKLTKKNKALYEEKLQNNEKEKEIALIKSDSMDNQQNMQLMYIALDDFEKMFVEDAIAENLIEENNNEFRQMLNERCVNQTKVKAFMKSYKLYLMTQKKLVEEYKKLNKTVDFNTLTINDLRKEVAKNKSALSQAELAKQKTSSLKKAEIVNILDRIETKEAEEIVKRGLVL
jgi:hypothetical protein